jgi:maltodextrin utilization protein YvdJ
MSQLTMYSFIAMMWGLILAGGGVLVLVVAKISIRGFGDDVDFLLSSAIKALVALALVIVWIVILSKLKNRIFQKEIRR